MTCHLVCMIEKRISASYITFLFDKDTVVGDICDATYVLFVYHVHEPLTDGVKVAKSNILGSLMNPTRPI